MSSSPSHNQAHHHGAIVSQSSDTAAPTQPFAKKKRRLDLITPDAQPSSKKERTLSSATRVYILADKLSEAEIDTLRESINNLGGKNSSLAYANLILTNLQTEKRVQRLLTQDAISRQVPVLHLSWLYDSAEAKLLQPYRQYQLVSYRKDEAEVPQGDTTDKTTESGVYIKPADTDQTDQFNDSATEDEDHSHSSREGSTSAGETSAFEGSHQVSSDDCGPQWQNVEYACLRPSPLKSRYNQDLVDELEVLRLQRIQAGRQEMNATAYGRAISAVKALPFELASNPARAKNIKGVGPKIAKLIVQFYREGFITEAKAIREDSAVQCMNQFMELYGIGPKRAREYYSDGARSLEDVIRRGGSLGTHLHIQECLRILPDLRCKIPRAEVLEIAHLIQSELDLIRPGCLHTICGGFRRGKLESNDVDIVITDPHPTSLQSQLTCMDELLRSMKKRALITHVINITTPSSTFESVFSHLDIAEIVVLPRTSQVIPIARHRRVDLIFCPYQTYGAAVLGWTGSRQFERDLRLLAKHRGFKFHSTGLVNQRDDRPHRTPQEEDIFQLLQIPYMPPHLRNCDA